MTDDQIRDGDGRYGSRIHPEPSAALPGHWPVGEQAINRMIESGDLERVEPSAEHAKRLLSEADQHLLSASKIAKDDPTAAYVLIYDSARKALTAVLAAQGLRSTSKGGGHVILQEAVEEQLGNVKIIVKPLGRIRKTRHGADYPSMDTPPIEVEDVMDDLPKVQTIVDQMRAFVPKVGPF